MSKEYFNERAKDWDKDPEKSERAKAFAREIDNFISGNKRINAFEFGCGTGLLSYYLKDSFEHITLADNSEGMIGVLKERIKKESIRNFTPLLTDIFTEEVEKNNHDVIYTLMTLHHVDDINKILRIFYQMLKPGGYLCIGDLDKEDGTFHSAEADFKGHKGFDILELSALLINGGFKIEFYKIFYEIIKNDNGKIKKFPLFLMIGKKNGA